MQFHKKKRILRSEWFFTIFGKSFFMDDSSTPNTKTQFLSMIFQIVN